MQILKLGAAKNLLIHSRSALFLASVLCVFGSTFTLTSNAQSIKTDRAVYSEPTLPTLPSAGGKFTDPVFGTQIMRATDAVDCPAPGCGTYYNQWPTFNSDNTRILIRKGISGDVIIKAFDPVNFTLGAILRTSPTLAGGVTLEWQGATWSRTDPDLIYVHVNYYNASYPSTGMKLYTYRPSTNVFTLLKDFAPELAPGQPDYLFEMHVDAHDEIFTLMHNRVGDAGNPIYFIVWKKSTNTVLQHIPNTLATFGPKETANAAAPDKSGRWIIFPFNLTQAVQIGDLRIRILDLQTNTWQTVYWTGADDSPSHGDAGTSFMIGHGNFSGAANSRPLTDVHSRTLLFDYKNANGTTDWSNDQHMSLYADDETWAMMSLYDNPAETIGETGVFENEIMQFSTMDPLKFRRLLHHRSDVKNTTETNGYWAIPKATISRDGRFIAYTSNWEDSGRYDLFIAKIEPPSQPTTPVNVTWTNVANATASGNNLTATAANGRGETAQTINSGNGSIIGTATLSQPPGIVRFGLNSGPFTGLPSEIDYGWRVYDNGVAYPCINDVPLIDYIQTTTNDILEVRINGTSIEWYHNSSLIHTEFEQSLSYPYRGAATLSASGNQILNVRMSGVASVRTNVALAANGGTATASSAYSSAYPASGANDSDRKGLNWGYGGGWNEAGPAYTFPDWLQVDFNESKTISEIDVFSIQDHYNWPVEPTEAMTFTLYGLTGYEVQYWDGTNWVTIPGGSVAGNNKVWRKFMFAPVSTTKIRVWMSASTDGWSRLAEVEAWTDPSPTPRYDQALAANGAVATASSSYAADWGPSGANNGDRKSLNWGNGGGWNDPGLPFPDWLQIDFAGSKTIDEIDVFTLQDNWGNPAEPTETMTFSQWGLTGYEVQYWDGSAWVTVPGGNVTGNNKVWRRFTFSPITTTKIRVLTNASVDGYSRITEVEAYDPASGSGGSMAPSDVTWTNIVNASASGNTLIATASSGRGETTQSIASGNGSIIGTATLSQPPGIIRLGLNSGPFTGLPSEIDYSWRVYDNGVAYPCINDVPLINYIQAANNDTLEVRINGTSIEWYHNSSLIHTELGQSLSYPYRGAATLSARGNKLLNVRMTGAQ